jgi:hypothetical protein
VPTGRVCTGSGLAVAALVTAQLVSGCAYRNPYNYASPPIASVSEPEPAPNSTDTEPPRQRLPRRWSSQPRGPRATPDPVPPVRTIVPSRPLQGSRAERLAAVLRALVGRRDRDSSDVGFALAALRALGARLDGQALHLVSAEQLIALARQRGALSDVCEPLLGDLLVFDEATSHQPASLVGVAVSSDTEGTIEFVYLARGVVRRGYVNVRRREEQRDEAGRILNTFVRHSDGGDDRSTRYLAGELFAGVVRLDRLLGG